MGQPAPVEDVLVHREEGDAFLLHVASGRYFGLNRAGLVIWDALVAGADPVVALQDRWPNIPAATCERDAAALITKLIEAGLVEPAGEGG